MKKILNFLGLSLSIFILAGCTPGVINKEKINSDTVTIYYDQFSNAKPLVFSSSNTDDAPVIKEVTAIASQISEYKAVPPEKLYAGTCEMWLKFGDDMVIGIYSDKDYGYVGTDIDPIGDGALYLPTGLSKCVSDIIDVYGYTYKSFSGTVTAVHENSVTITPNNDTNEIQSSDSIVVSVTEYTSVFSDKTLSPMAAKDIPIGSTLEITYDGNIQESYPAGIPGATMIRVYN